METPTRAELRAGGLRYASDAEPGIRRRRHGRGTVYRDDTGAPVDAATRRRIESLAIPPAWTEVWIARDPRAHLQATGRDARGRKQYRYHPVWREMRDDRKFAHLATFGASLGDLRRQLDADLARPGFDHTKMIALVLALMDLTLIRVGNDEYARTNGSYGLTTLRRRHVHLDGTGVALRFQGKGGVRHQVTIDDRRLARLVRRCHQLGGRELFGFVDHDGVEHRVDSADANDYLRRHAGDVHTVKTFRTWGASAIVVNELAALDAAPTAALLNAAIDAAAARLGNTRAVARGSYVHPEVGTWATDGRLAEAWRRSRTAGRLDRPERALLRLLADADAVAIAAPVAAAAA